MSSSPPRGLRGEQAGSNVSVIDAETIQARNPGSVVDLLRDLPGVFVQQSGGRGSVVSLFTRGAKPNFTLVLLDGVKANDPTNTRGGSYDFSTLDLNDIERIEFVRGPASAIYGSDAVGGVINIISRRGGDTLDAGAEGGRRQLRLCPRRRSCGRPDRRRDRQSGPVLYR